ncbi:MAG: DMT family transporter [Rhodobacteraceae bacterium]|nr:DMT family transporter [Paracoccaceae bacterium]
MTVNFSRAGLAPLLLVYVGVLTGVTAPLGKLGAEAGISPLVWAAIVSSGVALLLAPWLAWQGRLALPRGAAVRYVIIAGLITFVGANLVLFVALPRLGAGQMGLMFALSPVMTLALASLAGLRRPGVLGLVGVMVGMMGAILVAAARMGEGADLGLWSLFGLVMPLLLAIGNVYRTLDWPDGADPAVLAMWSHAVALAVFFALILGLGVSPEPVLSAAPWVVMAQLEVSAVTFPAFFLLQRVGGPVMLSQLGYVAAATGFLIAVALMGEIFGPLAWVGVGFIVLGIFATILDGRIPGFANRGAAC